MTHDNSLTIFCLNLNIEEHKDDNQVFFSRSITKSFLVKKNLAI